MKSGQTAPGRKTDELDAAKIFYFCYCILGEDRVGAENAARCVLAELRKRAEAGSADKAGDVCFAALALKACAAAGTFECETAERLLSRVFRFSAPEIARLTGRSVGQVECALRETSGSFRDGIPLLPLLEGECMTAHEP